LKRAVSANITYINGYDVETFSNANEKVCVLTGYLMDELSLQLGDTVILTQNTTTKALTTVATYYTMHIIACLISSAGCAVVVTNRNILELLQVKE